MLYNNTCVHDMFVTLLKIDSEYTVQHPWPDYELTIVMKGMSDRPAVIEHSACLL